MKRATAAAVIFHVPTTPVPVWVLFVTEHATSTANAVSPATAETDSTRAPVPRLASVMVSNAAKLVIQTESAALQPIVVTGLGVVPEVEPVVVQVTNVVIIVMVPTIAWSHVLTATQEVGIHVEAGSPIVQADLRAQEL